jgi:hypothetical protein
VVPCDVAEGAKGRRDSQDWDGKRFETLPFHQHRGGSVLNGVLQELVTIEAIPTQRHEQFALHVCSRVGRNTTDREITRCSAASIRDAYDLA